MQHHPFGSSVRSAEHLLTDVERLIGRLDVVQALLDDAIGELESFRFFVKQLEPHKNSIC